MSQTWKSEVVRVATPDGMLYLIIMLNDDGSIYQFNISIGKAGTALAAWATALASVMTLAVQNGATLEDLLTVLSSITSDGKARTLDTTARSGPEGVWQGLLKFRQGWPDSGDDTHEITASRGATVGAWAKTRG